MNREEAIAIIRKEYLCVDRDCDIERSCGECDLMMPSKEPILEAYKVAIKALEQEPKTGHWIADRDDSRRWDKVRFYCSECGKWQTYGKTDYCPSCGAKMIEPQESEE